MSGLPASVVVLFLAMSAVPVSDSTGVFEVQLTALINGLGLTHGGRCCSPSHYNHIKASSGSGGHHVSLVGQTDKVEQWYLDGNVDSHKEEAVSEEEEEEEEEEDEDDECQEECRTFLRICLSHQQQPLPPSNGPVQCTFGTAVSPVLGGNILDPFGTWGETEGAGHLVDPATIVRVNFTFSWPVFYTVVVEAWHDKFGNRSVADPSNVIARVLHAGRLLPSYRWQNVSSSFRGTHFSIRFRVVCDRNYYGSRCDVLCKKSDNPIIGHYACDDNGSPVCLDGWEGESCDKAKCSEACQEGRGYCDKPYECQCHLGWKGTDCHQCQTYPGCLHGYCVHAWQCICHQDWSGSHCNIDNHFCQRYNPCKNGGTCAYDEVTNYTCSCPQGFGGVNCAHTVCYDGYCLNNGLCVMSAGRRSCRCRRGFDGHRCQNAEVTCGLGVCRNNGTCGRDGGDFRCLCRPGFKGEWCEVEKAECQSNPCRHGGVCRDRVNGFICECRTAYAGKNCELSLDPCTGFRCFNHGSCISTATGFTPSCLCRPEFTGQRCETPLDPCVGIYCLHGGTCLRIGSTDFQCACANEYTGSVCQIPPPSVVCKDQPCLHGGTCRRTHEGNMMCACAPGFRGALCESKVPVASSLTTIADVVDARAGEEDTLTPPQEEPTNLQVPNDSVGLHIFRAAIALWVTVCTTVTVLLRYT